MDMKKIYKKPVVIIENISLSTSVANGCDVKIDTANSGNCGLEFGDDMLFLSGVSGCTFEVDADDGRYNGICYHVPTDSKDMFNS